ncbi:hypothetical protein OS122_01895 [Mycolicibacterium mucogenicum]|uniref:hypothetical protein n=1 Tax=Mycolicibacterium mucogenicum TaxID=56689 RepID=UPI00226A0F4D|nr:hypothetical protein [Mycolicibacterium mucogenicum]MCX8559650.1 hypothetical protein [Mycolicibacterium mucogenicum]
MRTNWTLAAATVGAALTMLAPAGLAAAESAQDTINRLQSEGYVVTIDKLGTAPVSECTVTSVRNPQQTTQLVPWVGPGLGRNSNSILLPQTSRTISVSLDCTGTH